MSTSTEQLQQQLKTLADNYARQLPDRFSGIEQSFHSALRQGWQSDEAELLRRQLHAIAGAAGTFGMAELGTIALEIEQQVQAAIEQDIQVDTGFEQLLAAQLAQLYRIGSETDRAEKSLTLPDIIRLRPIDSSQLYIYIPEESSAVSSLRIQLAHYGYQVTAFHDTAALEQALVNVLPIALIVDCSHAGIDDAVTDWLQQQHNNNKGPLTPILFVAPETDFTSRMQAVRAGGVAYFTPPLDVPELFERLEALNRQNEEAPYDVLIVDDDEVLSQHYSLLLTHAGMRTCVVNQPEQVLDVLASYKPDVILMDLYMPQFSGLDVATLIRQDKTYLGVPIVFLSSEKRTERQLHAMDIGGDEFLTKPINDEHLVAAVRYRARRARDLEDVMSSDSLTGLLKHTRIKEVLKKEAARAARQGEQLAFAMVDVDYFKRINDTHGHQAGDRVLKSLAHLLRQRLRSTDALGRYGGEEFALVLPNTDREGALSVLEDLRQSFSEIMHESGVEPFTATISIGVVTGCGCDDSERLIELADRALYRAKSDGRNRIVCQEIKAG